MIRYLTCLLLLTLLWRPAYPQTRRDIDSLERQLALAPDDTSRILVLDNLCLLFRLGNTDSALLFGRQALKEAQGIHFVPGEIMALSFLSISTNQQGNMPRAMELAFRAIELGTKYHMEYYAGGSFNTLGEMYNTLKDYPQAMGYLTTQELLDSEGNSLGGAAYSFLDRGISEVGLNRLDSGYYYEQKALLEFNRIFRKEPLVFTELGTINMKRGNDSQALAFYQKSLKISIENNETRATAQNYVRIASLYKATHRTDSALFYAEKGFNESKSIGQKATIREAAVLLSELYENSDTKKSLSYLKIADVYQDSLFGEGNLEAIQALVAQEQEHQMALEAARKDYQSRMRQYALIAGLAILLLIAWFLYQNNRRKQKANRVLKTTLGNLKSTQGQLEIKLREQETEAAMERVRTRTMAMQRSDELAETAQLLLTEFNHLGTKAEENILDRAFISNINEQQGTIEFWLTGLKNAPLNRMFEGSIREPIVFEKAYQAWKEHRKILVLDLSGAELSAYLDYLQQIGLPITKDLYAGHRVNSLVFFTKGYLGLTSREPLLPETLRLLERFAGVFDLTYTRFQDLKNAEAQVREARLEASLERVRSRTMSMQNSHELHELIRIVYTELTKLDLSLTRARIVIAEPKDQAFRWWMAHSESTSEPRSFLVKNSDHPPSKAFLRGWMEHNLNFRYELKGKVKKDYDNFLFSKTELDQLPDDIIASMKAPDQVWLWGSFNNFGGLVLASLEPPTEEQVSIMLRFAQVFDLTYTRFHDFLLAEAQAREATLEAALERVRSRTMAMQKSSELPEIASLIFRQLSQLKVIQDLDRLHIGLIDEDSGICTFWITKPGGELDSTTQKVPMKESPYLNTRFLKWKETPENVRKELFLISEYQGEETADFLNFINQHTLVLNNSVLRDDSQGKLVQNEAYFSRGVLAVTGIRRLEEDAGKILLRFSGVFEQTYTRFLDLEKAEQQAREATIEASLERIRSKAMAMQHSESLAETLSLFYQELETLRVSPRRMGVNLMDRDTHWAEITAIHRNLEGAAILNTSRIRMEGHPVMQALWDHWIDQVPEFSIILRGSEIRNFYDLVNSPLSDQEYPQEEIQYGYGFCFEEGTIFTWSGQQLEEQELQIFRKFKTVLSISYKRYKELKEAESRALMATRQASLDRVRAEIASMRTTGDLQRITPLLWKELTTLGVPFIRSGVFIVDEEAERIHSYLSTPDGKALASFDLPLHAEGIAQTIVPAWRKNQVATRHWSAEEFAANTRALVDSGAVSKTDRMVTEQPDSTLDLHFFPFLQGMLYVGNPSPLNAEERDQAQSLAAAFSAAYARYEDFNRLEAAKVQVDNTLTELRSTQNQLVQREKMASLGELTAGIAHEIQNPLNFVNNFSEVSVELLQELKEEIVAGHTDDVVSLADDLAQNLEKINYHGKRADSIVKGMLEHSRTRAGEKQLTDLNILAEEFLKLSYHGLRAKDKDFNAEFLTHLTPNLLKANVVQQDMGRVLLNLFNNAFYAVNQKRKTAGKDYRPEVSVSTLSENGSIVIKVKDNGNGIAEAIKDKIMQPFFTTKPTGEGTGLGLSLSYDIVVKGHGGSITVDTREGAFTEFTLTLPSGTKNAAG